jgi:flagellar biogenesis protein FliO
MFEMIQDLYDMFISPFFAFINTSTNGALNIEIQVLGGTFQLYQVLGIIFNTLILIFIIWFIIWFLKKLFSVVLRFFKGDL